MKAVKLTQKMLKMHPMDLLVKLGAVDANKKQVYPQHVYLSKEDSKTLKNNLKKSAKESAPNSPTRLLNYLVGCDWLNYGPNEGLAEVIRSGYALVDHEGIEKEKN
jgi:hypothetical protein